MLAISHSYKVESTWVVNNNNNNNILWIFRQNGGDFIADKGSSVVKCCCDWQDRVANQQAGGLWHCAKGAALFGQSSRVIAARATFRGKVGFGAWRSHLFCFRSAGTTTKTSARGRRRCGKRDLTGHTQSGWTYIYIWTFLELYICTCELWMDVLFFTLFLLKPAKLPERAWTTESWTRKSFMCCQILHFYIFSKGWCVFIPKSCFWRRKVLACTFWECEQSWSFFGLFPVPAEQAWARHHN